MKITFFALLFVILSFNGLHASSSSIHQRAESKIFASSSSEFHKKKRPNLFLFHLKKRVQRTKKITAALLAFPLPFGVLALHRIYLGTKPYVPVVYIATIGGVLGILPFIDFCVLLMDSNADRYYNNSKVFMWVK